MTKNIGILEDFLQLASAAEIGFCGTHYLHTKNFLSSDLINKINYFWPDNNMFTEEVPDNYTLALYPSTHQAIDADKRQFWREFHDSTWPAITKSIELRFKKQVQAIFGDVHDCIEPATPLTLMQANVPYLGHGIHTHFYHAPNWVFTLLLYVDPEDKDSHGTTLHQLKIDECPVKPGTDFDFESGVKGSIDTRVWPGTYDDLNIPYESGSAFAFIDGPLSFHSVRSNFNDQTNKISRKRKILRAHMQINQKIFFKWINQRAGGKITQSEFFYCTKYKIDYRQNFLQRYFNRMSEMQKSKNGSQIFEYVKLIYGISIRDRLACVD